MTIDLALGTATRGAETDTLYNIEDAGGSEFNDTISGNALANYLFGGAGADIINGRDGNDTLAGGTENDNMDGGTGTDVVTFELSSSGVIINLATDTATRGTEVDRIYNIEGATGSNYVDQIRGDDAANVFGGLGGDDAIYGGMGNDKLFAEAGKDLMYGDAGKDVFDFNPGDTGIGASQRDVIADFVHGTDKIDLATIDAIAGGSDNAFKFIGASAFSAQAAGQLHYTYDTAVGATVIQGSTDADTAPEFEI